MSEQHQRSYSMPEDYVTGGYAPTYDGPLPDGDWYGPPRKQYQDEENFRPIPQVKETSWSQWKTRAKHLFLAVAALVMFLLLFVPCWNCIALVSDPVYVYVAGDAKAAILLTLCILLFIMSLGSITLLLKRPTEEVKTERTLLLVWGIFLSCLGVVLILFGIPLRTTAFKADQELMHRCKSGPTSKPLYLAFKDLGSLRVTPACKNVPTIEQCPGFIDYVSTDNNFQLTTVIRQMENSYGCSGFCEGLNSKGKQIYPPTLFSQSDYKMSCDGMAARHMRNFAEDIALQTVVEGTMLVSVAILISVAKLLGFCAWPRPHNFKAKEEDSYGATL